MQATFEAKQQIETSLNRGETTTCPCCGHTHRLYKRTITRGQVQFLYALFKAAHLRAQAAGEALNRAVLTQHQAINARDIQGQHMRGGDYSKLTYWGLVARVDGSPGHWAITAKGIAWLRGRITVPYHAFVLDGRVRMFSNEQKSIHEAYGERFELEEILT